MAHDPKREDYQRLSLRFARELDAGDPVAATRAFASFGRRFAQDRDSLPQSDADRAFHLVVLAAEVIDYELPFATDEAAEKLIQRGKDFLNEALRLDPSCHDALRMRSSSEAPTVDARYRFLAGHVREVRASCEKIRDQARGGLSGERATLAANIALRPYWRWLASMAEEALICGRNHDAIAAAEELLAQDPHDTSDVRFTLVYALAKLEDEEGLSELSRRYASLCPLRPADDAWITLARISLAHKRCDFASAREQLARLLATYPGTGSALIRQSELPDGEFARLRVAPYSEDELILAVSEGIVLLQEGSERSGKGVLGSWIAREVARMDPHATEEALHMGSNEGAQSS